MGEELFEIYGPSLVTKKTSLEEVFKAGVQFAFHFTKEAELWSRRKCSIGFKSLAFNRSSLLLSLVYAFSQQFWKLVDLTICVPPKSIAKRLEKCHNQNKGEFLFTATGKGLRTRFILVCWPDLLLCSVKCRSS